MAHFCFINYDTYLASLFKFPHMRRLLLCMFIVSLSMSIVGLALPIYAREELGASYTEIGLLGVTYCVLNAGLSVPVGRWMDRHGRKPLLGIGLLSLAFTFALFALARSVWQVLAIRFIAGAAEAPIWVGAQTAVADLSRPETRGRAMGAYGISWSAGFTLGPLLGGFLYAAAGASLTFVIGALVALASVIVLLATPLPKVVLKSARLSDRGMRRGLGPACFVGFIYVGIVSVIFTLFPAYALAVGLNVGKIGLLLMLFTAVRMALFLPFGALSDRVGYRPVLLWGLLGVSAACLGVATIEGFVGLAIAISFLGIMEGAIYPTVMSMTSKMGGMLNRGYALGVLNAAAMVGWGTLPGVGGVAADIAGGSAPYVLCALIAFAAACVTLRLIPKKL
jgi:MFS family permease